MAPLVIPQEAGVFAGEMSNTATAAADANTAVAERVLAAESDGRSIDAGQLAAIEHEDGPCLVLAGPGSGKTTVIVERFLTLCRKGIPASRQLVLTYTRKAADEMRERAERAHGPFPGEPPLCNYHSFAGRVVREWGWLIGISPAFRVPDGAERWLHLDAVLSELRPHLLWNPLRPRDLIEPLLGLIEAAKQELVTAADYQAWAESRLATCDDAAEAALLERHVQCAQVYAALEDRYRRHAVLDHDDTILYAERLIREQPAARRATAEAISHVMVDEYQDTNFAQARLVETLVAGHSNVLVVADDDQAIYKFRGASLANLHRFQRTYPGHVTVTLARNYRSTPQIVGAARAIIGGAEPRSRIPKRLVAHRSDGPEVELWEAGDERSETLAVARECRRLMEGGLPGADIAWLFRKHVYMAAAVAALQETGVPYQIHGGRGFFQQPEIKDALALLAAAEDPTNSQALLRCLRLPRWRMTGKGRLALVRACAIVEAPLCDVLEHSDGGALELEHSDWEAAMHCLESILELHRLAADQDVRDVFFSALETSEFLGILEHQTEIQRIQTGANLNKLGELLETFAEWSEDRRVETARHYLDVLRDSGEADQVAHIDPLADGVVLLTAHGAKGLEWPVVFITGCAQGRWPGHVGASTRMSLPDELVPEPPPEGDAAVDEERRLFYVAATRARDRLVFSSAKRYQRSFRDERRSIFLDGLGQLGDPPRTVTIEAERAPALRARRVEGRARPERIKVGVSDVATFSRCPRRFQYQRIYHMPAPTSVQQWFGQLAHSVLHAAGVRRMAGEQVGEAELAALWNDAWETTRGQPGRRPELRSHGEEQLRRYARTAAWREAHISAAERPFSLAVTAGDVEGRFDRVDHRQGAGAVVVDYKTGPPRQAQTLSRDLQVRSYAVALSRQEHVDTVTVELHHLQTGEVVPVCFDAAQLDRSYSHLAAKMNEMAKAQQERDYPAQPSSWACGRCDYRMVCDEGREIAARVTSS